MGATTLSMMAFATLLAAAPAPRTWSFEKERPQAPPVGFSFARTGDGRPGRWLITLDETSPAGHGVLTQVDRDETDYRFPVAVVDGLPYQDVVVRVKCKPVDGKVDQAGGVVFRYKDENNYYLARLNALENNVRLYHVQDGRRIQFAGWNGKVGKNTWHDLEVEARGARFRVSFDRQVVIQAEDHTFANGGLIGLWTKADSVTSFDDLSVTPL